MPNAIKSILVLGFLTMFMISCNDPKENQPKSDKNLVSKKSELPAVEKQVATSANVFLINSVSEAIKNQLIDFTWNENGEEIKFSEFAKGKAVLLNFWGTWCPPCRKELPDLVAISKEISEDKLIVIGVALERSPDKALQVVKDFAESKGIGYKLFIDSKQELANKFKQASNPIQGIPATFIFDKSFKLSSRLDGFRTKSEFMDAINKVL